MATELNSCTQHVPICLVIKIRSELSYQISNEIHLWQYMYIYFYATPSKCWSTSNSNFNVHKDGKSCEMNSLIVCHCTLCKTKRNEPNLMEKVIALNHSAGPRWRVNAPNVYSIVNLICNKMRKLNFKLNYFQAIFTFSKKMRTIAFLFVRISLWIYSLEVQMLKGKKIRAKKKHRRRNSWDCVCAPSFSPYLTSLENVISYRRQTINQHVQRSKMYLNSSFEC